MISQAPIAFITVCAFTTALAYLYLRWQYGDLLKNNKALIETLQKRLDLQMVAATPVHIEAPSQPETLITSTPQTSQDKLLFSERSVIDAHQVVEDHDLIYRTGHAEHNLRLSVVEICNTLSAPEVPVLSVNSVRAQLFYREIGGPHRFDIRLGAWVETDRTYNDFGVGESRLLIIASQDSTSTCAIENNYGWDEETYEPTSITLSGKSYEVIIQLMTGTLNHAELIAQSTFRLTTSPLSLRQQFQPPSFQA